MGTYLARKSYEMKANFLSFSLEGLLIFLSLLASLYGH